jgi:peptidoglycan LD-endopeptidase LytH
VIVIGFPMRADTRYRYRDNWGDPRSGGAEHYNHAHSREAGGLRRAHDGIDIYARRGEPVLAPFDGLVVEPASRWQPWIAERYGLTAVIVSEEELSADYIALLSHLDRLWVEPGQRVRRGEVIGTVGSTGNAEGGPPHVHFELRAPFLLTWTELGEERQIDAFNPYPSLVAADPNRSD